MQRLDEALKHRADRGTPVGADAMVERVAVELLGASEPQVAAFPEGGQTMTASATQRIPTPQSIPPRRRRWRAGLAFGAALVLVLAAIGVIALLPEATQDVSDTTVAPTTTAATATTVAPPTTAVSSTAAVTTTIAAPPTTLPPALGEGWEMLLTSMPDGGVGLEPVEIHATASGYYVALFERGWHLANIDGEGPALVQINVPTGEEPGSGFVTGGPGVVAWATVGPESHTEGQLWVSSNGVDFERVARDLLEGCTGETGCMGTRIYTAAAAPDGRVVALGYDPLVWDAECECYELNPVALVSDDGFNWAKTPLDLLDVLPSDWQGEATIRNPLVHVDGRWLTYGTRYSNEGSTTDTAFFASENGIDWEAIDTGSLFEETYLLGMASNDRGVAAISRDAAYWSADGLEWTRTELDVRDSAHEVAAYDAGFVVVSSPRAVDDDVASVISFSPDGASWHRQELDLGGPTHWNALVGDGQRLVAIGVTEPNLRGIWRWSS